METILDASFLFLLESDWDDIDKRNDFLNFLIERLNFLAEYSFIKVLWDNELEAILWTGPQRPPWSFHKDYKLKIIPIIYKNLSNKYKFIETYNVNNNCQINQNLNNNSAPDNFVERLMILIHHCIHINKSFDYCLGMPNLGISKLKFSCKCNKILELEPNLIYKPIDWFKNKNLITYFWPYDHKITEQEFIFYLETIRKIEFEDKKFLYKPKLSRNFQKKIINIVEDQKENLIRKIVIRLILHQREAENDARIMDEGVEGTTERRFRITQRPSSRRIHYCYSNKNEIELTEFYDCGEHDKGL